MNLIGTVRRLLFAISVIGVLAITLVFTAPWISGPRRTNLQIGILEGHRFSAVVRSPNVYSWLSGIAFTCSNGPFPPQAQFKVKITQSNMLVFSKEYTKQDLIRNNWMRGESYTAPMLGGRTQPDGGPLHAQLGFGREFQIEVDHAGTDAKAVQIWLRFVDDRIVKPPGPSVLTIDASGSHGDAPESRHDTRAVQ